MKIEKWPKIGFFGRFLGFFVGVEIPPSSYGLCNEPQICHHCFTPLKIVFYSTVDLRPVSIHSKKLCFV